MPVTLPPGWTPLPDGRQLRIVIGGSPVGVPESIRAQTDEAWDRICLTNPKAFDGPILAFTGADAAANLVRATRDTFRRLAVRPEIDTGVTVLGVTGVLEAPDRSGVAHALLGLRSRSTRVFGGMWEFGPSGGVDPPPAGHVSMNADDLWRVLANEIREEIGLHVDPRPTPPSGLLDDPEGQSVELVVRVRLPQTVEELTGMMQAGDGVQRWEYDDARWVPFDSLTEFTGREPSIPSAGAIADLLTLGHL